eukprot:1178879-Prorocentrum_minimum.AAC.1
MTKAAAAELEKLERVKQEQARLRHCQLMHGLKVDEHVVSRYREQGWASSWHFLEIGAIDTISGTQSSVTELTGVREGACGCTYMAVRSWQVYDMREAGAHAGACAHSRSCGKIAAILRDFAGGPAQGVTVYGPNGNTRPVAHVATSRSHFTGVDTVDRRNRVSMTNDLE